MRLPLKALILKILFQNHLVHKINTSLRKVKTKRKLTREDRKAIQSFYKRLCGHRVPVAWHRYMYSRTGEFYENYIPTSLFRIELIGRMNRWDRVGTFSDKNLSDVFLPNVNQPKTILKNLNGYYYSEGHPISEMEAIKRCSNLKDVIIKPSLDEGGNGVRGFSVNNGITDIDKMPIQKLFNLYFKDFIIQERIHQHEKMSRLNPSSVNTIRVLTYRMDMEILLLYAVVRIGKQGMAVDNESQGGISARINADGTIAKYAYGAPGNEQVETTDSGVVLDGYPIPSYNEVINLAKQCHYQLPYFDIIGWDFCIDDKSRPVLIEWNSNPDLSQTANGPAFGEYTAKIISSVYKRVNTRNAHW